MGYSLHRSDLVGYRHLCFLPVLLYHYTIVIVVVKSVLEYFSDFYRLSSFGVSSFDPSSSRLGALEPKTFALRILSISSCCLSNLLFSAMLVNRLGVITLLYHPF